MDNEFIDKEFMDALLYQNFDKVIKLMNKTDCDSHCKTCIHVVHCSGKYDFLKKILKYDKNYMYLKNDAKCDIYAFSCMYNLFDLVKLMNELDENINNNTNICGLNSLMLCDNLEIIKYLINKSNVNHINDYGQSVLLYKCSNYIRKKDIEIIDLLIKNGANMYDVNQYGTIFKTICNNNNKEVIKIFIFNGYKYEEEINKLLKENVKNEVDVF